ncbi:hypothetical protein IGI04_006703 [Brassica rapa subsp. trilocularis]|uniref:Shugoshin C-terminal domain-containing protein n=1 Tax=Brassica rapa subsp. trilocularis TaxID=1813537 RepID=A0ABQ7NKW2_BRACM|nr:hypothetical protein IGI04_006703 [Brassica rapa subsp. trilocularis]
MGSSRDDSEEQFSFNTDYSPPATCDLGTQQLIARLAAEEERNDLRADEADDGKKQARKRKLISLVDSEEESDVEITPPTQSTKPRRQTTYGTAKRKPMLQSTLDGGSGSSARARSQKNVPLKAPAKAYTFRGTGLVSYFRTASRAGRSRRVPPEEKPAEGRDGTGRESPIAIPT